MVPYEDRVEELSSQNMVPMLNDDAYRNSADASGASKTLLTQTRHARASQDVAATTEQVDRFSGVQTKQDYRKLNTVKASGESPSLSRDKGLTSVAGQKQMFKVQKMQSVSGVQKRRKDTHGR